MKKFILAVFIFIFTFGTLFSQDSVKIPLSHSVYDGWKKIERPRISSDGKWVFYEINPAKGDGKLLIYNTENGNCDTIPRGYETIFSYNSDYAVYKIRPQDTVVRKLKLLKKKKEDLPKDSLAIMNLTRGKFPIKKFSNIISYGIPADSGNWLTVLYDNKESSKSNKDSSGAYELNIINPVASKQQVISGVQEAAISRNGESVGFVKYKKGKPELSSVFKFDTKKEEFKEIFKSSGVIKNLCIDNNGEQLAFLQTSDTSKVKKYSLYLFNSKDGNSKKIIDTSTAGMLSGWEISLNEQVRFSEDGTKLYFGTAPKILPEPKDTIPDDEKTKVDIWNWNDGQIITQQNHDVELEKKRTYLSVYNIAENTMVQIADSLIVTVKLLKKGNDNLHIGISEKPYERLSSWEDASYKDYYVINSLTGDKNLVLEKKKYTVDFSPEANFLAWYETSDSTWKSYSIKDNLYYTLSKNIPQKFYDEEFDKPNDPEPYGLAGWTRNDEAVLVYDRYDIWKLSPQNLFEPVNLTKNGRLTKTTYRYIRTNEDTLHVGTELILKSFNEDSGTEGLYSLDLNNNTLKELLSGDYGFINFTKSKKSGKVIFQKYSYTEFQDLWFSNIDLKDPIIISNANPQQKNYLWGTVEKINWIDSAGVEQKGLLYKPENFDVTKKYPMIVYFYEKYTDQIHNHYIPNPSRSVVNFPLYNSNGYIIFIPDLTYKIGHPGKSALDIIMSGTKSLVDKGFIDRNNIGIQGQSWGGYQVAYLVTQTNYFKAAMSGAPVANMTSAYHGIRWESGVTRAHQYEQGQSRIGGTLWDKLDLYIENSPLFFANKVETPLLIMANDNDGAVPWQQGIEYFLALRRLSKPVWMLTYNGDEHNLTKWPNRVDLAIRMKQFFDHFLKGEPIPVWMKNGIKAIDKGLKSGYELTE